MSVVVQTQRRKVCYSFRGRRYEVWVPLIGVEPLWRYLVDGEERIMPITSDPIRYEGVRRQMLAGTGTARNRFAVADRRCRGRIPRRALGD